MANKWIQSAIQHPGALRAKAKKAGALNGGKIDAGWLSKAAGQGGTTGRQARLAQTLKGLRK